MSALDQDELYPEAESFFVGLSLFAGIIVHLEVEEIVPTTL